MGEADPPMRENRPGFPSYFFSSGETLADVVPVLDTVLTELPAQLDRLTVAKRGKIDQALERSLELDAHAVEARDRFEELELRAADRVACLLVAVTILRSTGFSFRFVLGDASLVLELGQQGRKLRDLRDDPTHARQLLVRLIHRVRAEPLHGSTIVRKVGAAPTLHGMESREAKQRLAESKVARLATVSDEGQPHIVPFVFALDGDTLYFAVDAKPKTTTNLKRLTNIAWNPSVSVLVDHFEADWRKLWWVRADGTARVITDEAHAQRATELLVTKYAQYRTARPAGPVVAIHIDRITGWSFKDAETEI